ncbi:MAG: 30S ribosomal protein S6 [Coraliomargarita sp.]
MSATTNTYKFSFILDLRNTEDDAAKVVEDIKETLTVVGGEATSTEDLGVREFSRAADRRFAQGHYIQMEVAGPGSVPAALKEKLIHDKRVNRIFVENA